MTDAQTGTLETSPCSLASRAVCLLMLGFLAACASGKGQPPKPQPQASTGGYYKVGKPYQIKGEWYYPKEDFSYDETGIASWYGDDFHAFQTANGETYNKNELTAAHPTLPMPSLARVTNLENGRAIVVRVNDRGPFSGARLIDVSQRAAQLLGFERQGTAKVRVQVLADESRAIAEAMRTYGSAPTPQVGPVPAEGSMAVASASFSPSAGQVESQTLAPLPPARDTPLPQAEPPARKLTVADVHPVPEYAQVPVSSHNDIFIQAGAFTKVDNATRLKASLGKISRASVVEVAIKGVQYYRVRLGPIPSVAEADKLLKQVKQAGYNESRIIVD